MVAGAGIGLAGGAGGVAAGAATEAAQAALDAVLAAVVERKLAERWSPQQIAGLRLEFPDDAEMQVSHETIYLSLYVQAAGRCARS